MSSLLLSFRDFRSGPAGRICAKGGLKIGHLDTWRDFTNAFSDLDYKKNGKLPDIFCALPGGTGDRALVQAILHAADYSHIADGIEGGTWSRLQYVVGDYAEAVAAAILRRG
ncbi:hypothetical protein [Pararhizobium sp. DWP1-1-3]|uniref:hypothetical protein n=1 Tax=Pararhizobium sp. DWP1-1-3 TaxID=2804652 RepID=UPI003CF952FD